MVDRPVLQIDGDEDAIVHAVWGRSGKRLILTVADPDYRDPRQLLLTPAQAAELGRFLLAGPDA